MYIAYIDESGVPEQSGTGNHFVLLGLAIPADAWKRLDQAVSQIKARYRLADSEIHTGWMLRKIRAQEDNPVFAKLSDADRLSSVLNVWKQDLKLAAVSKSLDQLKSMKKNQRETEPFAHLTFEERRACIQELADLVGGWKDARILGEAVDKRAYPTPTDPSHIFEQAFHQFVTRYDAFLVNRGKAIKQTLLGLIVQDNNETYARKLTAIMRRFHAGGTVWRTIQNIVETPLFVDSKLTSSVQLADISAYAVRRFLDNNEADLFNRIYPAFDRVQQAVVGFRHYTGKRPCNCRICQDHKRS